MGQSLKDKNTLKKHVGAIKVHPSVSQVSTNQQKFARVKLSHTTMISLTSTVLYVCGNDVATVRVSREG